MWNRETKPSSTAGTPEPVAPPEPRPVPITPQVQAPPVAAAPLAPVIAKGATLVIKGDLMSAEDLVIEGRVEGRISLAEHVLTIGPGAQVSAEVDSRMLILQGVVTGNVRASERVEIRTSGRMTGDLVSPKVQMADGATFSGRLETGAPARQAGARKERVA
jgi:cytoskeletal protein CcmA (bactofilin family)